jgi:Domain of unknown function (DUF4253)
MSQETGLMPILLGGLATDPAQLREELGPVDVTQLDHMDAATLGLLGAAARPWDEEEFGYPADATQLDHMDAASLLKGWWDGKTHEDDGAGDEYTRRHFETALAPFSRQFPGLAHAEDRQLSSEQREGVLRALPAARIGLIPASRPADTLPLIGWSGTANYFKDALPVAAVLRSWEERYGATLLQVGFDWIRLLADRPPRSVEHAQRIAAEHYAFCDECGGRGLTQVSTITASLMESPIWTFWWD